MSAVAAVPDHSQVHAYHTRCASMTFEKNDMHIIYSSLISKPLSSRPNSIVPIPSWDLQSRLDPPSFSTRRTAEAGYRFKYRSLLSDVLERSGPLVPGGRVHWKPTPQQQTQLQERDRPQWGVARTEREEAGGSTSGTASDVHLVSSCNEANMKVMSCFELPYGSLDSPMEGFDPAWQGFGPSKPSPLRVLDS